MKCHKCDSFGHKAQECLCSRRHSMKHNIYSSERTIHKIRRDNNVNTLWKSSEKQDYLRKRINMNTRNSGITRRSLQDIKKVWRRKSVGEQLKSYEHTNIQEYELQIKGTPVQSKST